MVQTADWPPRGDRACPRSALANSRSAQASPSTPFVTTNATSCWRPPVGSQSGYRRYGDTELKRLRFIRRAKALGFTLADIRELLSLSDERSVAKVKRAAEAKLADVEQRLAELERIRNGLRSLVAACPGHGRAEACPILNALNEEDASTMKAHHRPGLRHDGESRLSRIHLKPRRPRLPVLLGGVPHEIRG